MSIATTEQRVRAVPSVLGRDGKPRVVRRPLKSQAMIRFGLRVTDRMAELGLTPNALAVSIGVPTATLRNWMDGASIPAGWRLARLSKYLRMNQTKLLLGENQ